MQARAILDLRLQRLTALGRDEIKDELDKLAAEIADYLDILRSRARIQGIVKHELAQVKKDFATPRRTQIIEQVDEVEDEDLIQREDMVVTVSHLGYVKRVPLSTYRAQRRGGKGRAGHADARRGFRHAAVRRQYAHAGAVLLLGMAASTSRRSGACRWPPRRRAARR